MKLLNNFFGPVDMTEGEPWKKILLFTVPMLVGNIAQQLYNTVDSIVVGKYVGDNALAAVGSAGPILNLLLVLYVGISIGAGILVSQFYGAHNREGLSYTIGNSILLMLFATIFVAVAGSLVTRPLLKLLNTPDSIIDWCASYLYILFMGGAGLAYYNILSGVLRGLGDSVSALIYLVVACVLNIGLDLLFVIQFDMGVSGVALATAIAQAVSATLCAIKLYRMKEYFDLKFQYIKWNQKYAMNVVRLGIPSGVTQAIMSMSMIAVQSLTNSFGEQFIAANVILMRVDGFAMMPNFSFGSAMTTFAGQNVGANAYDRVSKGAKQGTLLALGVSTVVTGAILLVGRPLMGIFTDTEELVDLSAHLMRILAVGYMAMAVLQSLGGVMRGAGDTMTPMWISIFQTVGLRLPLAYAMVYLSRSPEYPQGRQELLVVSLLIAWVVSMLVTCFFYGRGKWRTKAVGNSSPS